MSIRKQNTIGILGSLAAIGAAAAAAFLTRAKPPRSIHAYAGKNGRCDDCKKDFNAGRHYMATGG